MQISVDAGGLCVPSQKQFGTYTLTKNMLLAFGQYDSDNQYTGYTFCKDRNNFPHFNNIRYRNLQPSLGWMSIRVSLEELMKPKEIYFGLSQAIPWLTRAKVLVFIHGLSFFLFKDLYKDSYEAMKDQLFYAVSRADRLFVSSLRVKEEMEQHLHTKKVSVLPLGIPFDMQIKKKNRKLKSQNTSPYFLFVGMDHPVKRVEFVTHAFKIFKEHPAYKDYRLLLIGNHAKYTDEKAGITVKQVNREELSDLYTNATAYVSASMYESYNFPVLEALAHECPVIATKNAVIPEMKPFVQSADHIEEFVDCMKQTVQRKKIAINKEKLQGIFDWKKTVTDITSQYEL